MSQVKTTVEIKPTGTQEKADLLLIEEKEPAEDATPPKQTQGTAATVLWQSATIDPVLEEIITPAEAWAVQTVAQPLIAKGVKVYNDNIPQNEIRPREYVVLIVDEEVRDINFSDNQNRNEESLCTFIVQGHGNTFQNWVVEISKIIHGLLRAERKKGRVRNIINRNIGLDETTQILSRTITAWYQYK